MLLVHVASGLNRLMRHIKEKDLVIKVKTIQSCEHSLEDGCCYVCQEIKAVYHLLL